MNLYKVVHAGTALGRTEGTINTVKINGYLSETVIKAGNLASAKSKAKNFTDVKKVKRIFK